MSNNNPLLTALPPETDHLTYLTILEYNLTRDQLPTLHEVLQDAELTSNIGWDLVHLLLPLLPAAEQCLQDVARLGNPREVVLKVTESLRGLAIDNGIGELDDRDVQGRHGEGEDEEGRSGSVGTKHKGNRSGHDAEEASTQKDGEVVAETQSTLAVRQFSMLLSMLSTLHSRIKTKYPSRFLSSSLRAVLRAYSQSAWSQDATTAVLQLIKTLSEQKRPNLPPRPSSKEVQTVASKSSVPAPEAQPAVPDVEENKLQQRLLQSFITHVLEYYMLCMSSVEDVTGLAWTSRLQEKAHPERVIPGRKRYIERFLENEKLHARDDTIGQIVVRISPLTIDSPLTLQALARDLEVDSQELLLTVAKPDSDSESFKDEDLVPSSAFDLPLSCLGALYLLVARKASGELFSSPADIPDISIFPDHALVVRNYLGRDSMTSIGTEAEATIDAVLCLGFMAYDEESVGQPQNDTDFNEYLQRLSLVSANTPSPTLRYHAHVLTSFILHSHPSDLVRLAFIRDTLEHCPYENLKASAIGWLKDEILAANKHQDERTEESSVFKTPVAIDITAPFIFPDLSQTLQRPITSELWTTLKLNFSFYLASLNFYYLLLSSTHIGGALDVVGLHKKHDVSQRFLAPLRQVSKEDSAALKSDGTVDGHSYPGDVEDLSDIWILDDALERITGILKDLGLNGFSVRTH